MGSGTFSVSSFCDYSRTTKGRGMSADGKVNLTGLSAQEVSEENGPVLSPIMSKPALQNAETE